MRTNRAKQLAREGGKPAIGTMCNAASPLIGEWLGHSGYDFIVVDLQHGENNLDSVRSMLQALSSTTPRPSCACPRTCRCTSSACSTSARTASSCRWSTRAEAAAEVVANVRYAPKGQRSWGPVRGAIYGGADYFANSTDELLTLVMLESAKALANAREILAVDGVDGCFVGPADLGISLGHSPDALPNVHPESTRRSRRSGRRRRRTARSPAFTASASTMRASASPRAITS